MPAEPIITSDGSHTLKHPHFEEHYHSTFGAITESRHIFIQAGLAYAALGKVSLKVLEMGFGTGLNALLSFQWANQKMYPVEYFGIEAFPLAIEKIEQLNYTELLKVDEPLFEQIHAAWKRSQTLSSFFRIKTEKGKLEDTAFEENTYDLVYFDAFSPEVQPELWSESQFKKIAGAMVTGGVLTTYSCKGIVKRALKSAGFNIEKLPGPPGKREFLRAKKL